MPYIYAHRLLGSQALELFSPRAKNTAMAYPKAFAVGLQGPDVFFFKYRPLLSFPLKALGNRLHDTRVDETMGLLLRLCCDSGVRMAYFLGYLCHYALDAAAHPYVYYFSEKPQYHTPFEVGIDEKLMQYRGISMAATKPASLLALEKEQALEIGALYTEPARLLGFEINPSAFYHALCSMRRAQRLLFDAGGKKARRLAPVARKFTRLEFPFELFTYDPKRRESIDFLNLNRAQWRLPYDENVASTESFLDIMQKAADAAAQYADLAVSDADAALSAIGGRSFLTGRDWREKLNMTAFDGVYS